MSGHSKWSKIKRKKEEADTKKGQQFTKLAANIKQAANRGTDPKLNAILAEAIKQAKQSNMPQSNIDNILTKAKNTSLTTATYEAFSSSGAALIIKTSTDNTRRTVAEIRAILKNHHGNLGEQGSVMWKFIKQNDTYVPQFPLHLDNEALQKTINLINELNKQSDTLAVYTDAAN